MVIGGATNAGNVGIGTDNPASMLHLHGTDPILRFQDSAGGDVFGIYNSDSLGLGFYNFTDSRQDVTIDGGGNVGIGTTSMSGFVHTYSAQRYMLYLESTYGTDRKYWFRNDGGTLQLGEGAQGDSQVGFTFDVTNKKLAIGTRSTTAELTVIGQISGSNTATIGPVADNGDALITDGVDGGLYSVLTVKETGNLRFNLDFEGAGSTNSLTLNSNSTSDILNIMPDGTIYMGVEHGTLAKNSAHRLSVVNPSGASWISTFAYNGYPALQLYRTNNNSPGSAAANFDATSDGDIIGAINWYGSSASQHTLGAVIDVRQDGPASTNTPTRMDFYVSNGANISNKLMSLDGSSQRVAIGVGLSPSGAPQGILEVKNTTADDYAASFHNIGNAANYYGIRVQAGANDGSGTTYYLAALDGDGGLIGSLQNISGTFQLVDHSDVSLKKNIEDTKIQGLESINKIKVRDFNWKKSGDKTEAGFVAQELKEAFSPAVSVLEDGLLAVSRERLVPVLVKAIQELSAKIDELQNQ